MVQISVESAHRNLPRLGLFALVERDRQHAVIQPCLHRRFIDGGRQREAALEARIAPLAEQVVALRLGFGFAALAAWTRALLAFELFLGGDGQRLILQSDIDNAKNTKLKDKQYFSGKIVWPDKVLRRRSIYYSWLQDTVVS